MKYLLLVLPLMFVLNTASADDFLNEKQIESLFSNKTFDIHNVKKDKRLKGYDDSNGNHFVYIPWKDKTSERKWWIKDNMHCTSHPKRGDSCKKLKDMGNGVYYGYTGDDHSHTLSNFLDGDHL